MGVANCEQAAEWLLFFRNSVLGIRDDGERPSLVPALPFEITACAVSNVPTPWGTVGYRLRRDCTSVDLEVSRQPCDHALDVRVPVPRRARNIRVTSGATLEHGEQAEGDAVFVSYTLPPETRRRSITWYSTG